MSTRIFCYDTEFLEDGRTIELISIGIVCDDRREYYAVNSDMPWDRIKGNDWLLRNVVPQLPLKGSGSLEKYLAHPRSAFPKPPLSVDLDTGDSQVKPKWVIANEVRDFITEVITMGDRPSLWANYSAYDHVVLAQLFGPMIQLPDGIPMFTNDLQQLKERLPGSWKPPGQLSGEHSALEDARYNMRFYEAAMAVLNG